MLRPAAVTWGEVGRGITKAVVDWHVFFIVLGLILIGIGLRDIHLLPWPVANRVCSISSTSRDLVLGIGIVSRTTPTIDGYKVSRCSRTGRGDHGDGRLTTAVEVA